ncbi:MAG: hypothetical protein GF408_04655 [Candidatus Omnitrophica bacterium]|nr:hypothetical protein [Candidatus Omnitrophota bacterium]
MIERMRKVTLIVTGKERERFISLLRKAGVLHVENIEAPSSHEISFVEERISRIEHSLDLLSPYRQQEDDGTAAACGDREILEQASRISELVAEKAELEEKAAKVRRTMEWFAEWGEFDPEDLRVLSAKGAGIDLYKANSKIFADIDKEKARIIKKEKGEVFFFTVGAGKDDIPLEPAEVPARSPEDYRKEEQELLTAIKETESRLREKARGAGAMEKCRARMEKELEFLKVKCGMGEEEKFAYLKGFFPAKKETGIKKLAEKNGAGYVIEDPSEEDEPPTLITNPGWIRIIDPVFKFMNTLPGYSEFDISFVFLVFFSIFFAMLIGDAGYGLVFVLVTFLARRKLPGASFEPFFLMYLLGGTTVVWGAITGTWFGAERIARLPVFRNVIVQDINSFASGNQDTIIYICFVLGAVHLTVAHLMKIARRINSPRALGDAGWVAIVWGMFFAAGKFVIGKPFPGFAGYLFVIGILLVLFFENFQKNFFKGMAETLSNLPLAVIGSFSDVVSYLRLFAVGYASVVLAQTFNTMALGGGVNSVLGGLAAAVILFLGHTLNIVLGMMAVVVHGIRLNMLEFSGHLGMQWTGKKYEPFRE